MWLQQHGAFFFVLGDVLRSAQNITKNMKNLLRKRKSYYYPSWY